MKQPFLLFRSSIFLRPSAGFKSIIYHLSTIILPALFSSCENDQKEIDRLNSKASGIETAYKVESLLSQNGKLRAKLISPYMLRYAVDSSYLEFPRTLHVNFYDSLGTVESQVDALYGKYFENRSLVYLRDSVRVFNVKGDTLWTPDLWWDQNSKSFYTEKAIRLFTKDKRLWGGKGFRAAQDLSGWRIFDPTGIINVPESMNADGPLP